MKVAAGQVEGFLRRLDPQIRAVLLFGPDAGLVRERADTLARAVCPDLRDPFRVAELTAATLVADPARLADEAAQISLMAGRRVVRLRDAGDQQAPLFARFRFVAVADQAQPHVYRSRRGSQAGQRAPENEQCGKAEDCVQR